MRIKSINRKDSGVELTAPAGSYESLAAAVRAGADSVYFGVGHLNMRARSSASFDIRDLRRIARICRWCGVRSYLALNVTLYEEDLDLMREICDAAKNAGVSAIIASDFAVMKYCRGIGVEVHVSVQANVANTEAVKHYAEFADAIVLARELTLERIKSISDYISLNQLRGPSGELVRIELFGHGALCVAVSGHCYMSLATEGASANRGDCYQPCRRKYRIIDDETGVELNLENQYVMSPRDLCTVQHLDKLKDAGLGILKIEGRGRSADYVSVVTRVYREALDALQNGEYTEERKQIWMAELNAVFNRGFWDGGFYCGKEMSKWSGDGKEPGPAVRRLQIGVVSNFYNQQMVAEFRLWQEELKQGDELLFEGVTTGAVHHIVDVLKVDGVDQQRAVKNDIVTLQLQKKVRRNDKIYLLVPQSKST